MNEYNMYFVEATINPQLASSPTGRVTVAVDALDVEHAIKQAKVWMLSVLSPNVDFSITSVRDW